MSSVIDLSNLTAPDVLQEVDFDAILQEMLDDLSSAMPDLDLQVTDPAYKVLERTAYKLMLERQQFNDRARQLLIAHAGGGDLDHIGVTYYATERQDGESDADYRRRILLAYDSWSTAGSVGGYVFHALSADADVKDATAISEAAGQVLVTVLSGTGDGSAPASLVSTVDDALNAEKVRPLNDRVVVQSADVTTYEVDAELELRSGPGPGVVAEEAKAAVQSYVDARHRLGEDIVRGAIEAALYVEGVERATLHKPAADINLDETQVGYCTGVEVTVNG